MAEDKVCLMRQLVATEYWNAELCVQAQGLLTTLEHKKHCKAVKKTVCKYLKSSPTMVVRSRVRGAIGIGWERGDVQVVIVIKHPTPLTCDVVKEKQKAMEHFKRELSARCPIFEALVNLLFSSEAAGIPCDLLFMLHFDKDFTKQHRAVMKRIKAATAPMQVREVCLI